MAGSIPSHLFASDPTCRALPDGRFWVFTTHDQCSTQFQAPADYWDNMYSYQAYSTRDFTSWIHHGSILSRFDIGWATANAVWDGDAEIPANGRFYAYIPVRTVVHGHWHFQMAVLVADRPEGPYADALSRPFLTGAEILAQGHASASAHEGALCLSPTVIIAEDGTPWLLFGQFHAFLAPLRPDMLGFSGPIRELEIPRLSGEAIEYIEGPMLHRIGGRWVFSYMTYKNWQGKLNANFAPEDPEGPYIQVCEADSMFGPFRSPRHWIYPLAADDCNVQHAMARYRDRWIVAYHLPWRRGSESRQLHLTEAGLDRDGRLLPIHPATASALGDPVHRQVIYAAWAKRFAQEYHAAQGALQGKGPLKAHHVVLFPGGHLRFDDLDFGPACGSGCLTLEFVDEPAFAPSGTLEIRIDSPKGPILASVDLTREPGSDGRVTVSIPAVHGMHPLYVIGVGPHASGATPAPALCRLLSFRFHDPSGGGPGAASPVTPLAQRPVVDH
jgi:hypothetical protein